MRRIPSFMGAASMFLLGTLVLCALMLSCGSDAETNEQEGQCVEEQTRCKDDFIEKCSGNKWFVISNCAAKGLKCTDNNGTASCITQTPEAMLNSDGGLGSDSKGQSFLPDQGVARDGHAITGKEQGTLPPPSKKCVSSFPKAVSIAAAWNHTCALLADGKIRCWGKNYGNQKLEGCARLGGGPAAPKVYAIGDDECPSDFPFPDDIGAPVAAIDGNNSAMCAVTTSGGLRCWGSGKAFGYEPSQSCPGGEKNTVASLGDIPVGDKVKQVSVGGDSLTCVLLENETVKCWGKNNTGQLGLGDGKNANIYSASKAKAVVLGAQAKQISCSSNHCCALTTANKIRCWGALASMLGYPKGSCGAYDKCGDDETPASLGNVPLDGTFTSVVASWTNNVAIRSDGKLVLFGSNTTKTGPKEIETGGKAKQVCFESDYFFCWLKDDGGVRCNVLKTAKSASGMAPPGQDIDLGGKAQAITCGMEHVCALLTTGRVRCWGKNENGELGYGYRYEIGDTEPPATAGDVPL